MNLERSLMVYGLLECLDYVDWREIDVCDAECQTRICRLIDKLSIRLLGENHVTVELAGFSNNAASGLRFEGYNMTGTFIWANTVVEMQNYRWTCGIVEGSFRRFLTTNHNKFPVHLLSRIPARLSGWTS